MPVATWPGHTALTSTIPVAIGCVRRVISVNIEQPESRLIRMVGHD